MANYFIEVFSRVFDRSHCSLHFGGNNNQNFVVAIADAAHQNVKEQDLLTGEQ